MEWNLVAGAILAWVGQFFKANRRLPTWAAQAGIGAIALVLYFLGNVPKDVTGMEGWIAWLRDGFGWALAVLGGSSLAAGTGLAPRTDSHDGPLVSKR